VERDVAICEASGRSPGLAGSKEHGCELCQNCRILTILMDWDKPLGTNIGKLTLSILSQRVFCALPGERIGLQDAENPRRGRGTM
jgi:hypothetical protein